MTSIIMEQPSSSNLTETNPCVTVFKYVNIGEYRAYITRDARTYSRSVIRYYRSQK